MPTTTLNGQTINYQMRVDKRRKNIQLRIIPPATVELVAPGRLSGSEIERIITAKSKWITTQLDKLALLATNPVNQTLTPGDQILYMGEPHILVFLPGNNKPEVFLEPRKIVIKAPAPDRNTDISAVTGQILKAWLVNQAVQLFRDKTKYWSSIIGVFPVRITIKDQKTRWGSCSSLGNINYNWRIIMAPPPVADYLIIHELCHLLVPNHSAKFWDEVRRFSPDYAECRKWLEDNGKLLSRIL